MQLFLIRHGQSTGNLGKVYVGQTDVPLTDEGIRQAQSIRPVLETFTFDRVYTSDLQRAIDTQKNALPDCQPVRTKLLREIDVGRLVGTPVGELKAPDDPRYPKHRDYASFEGESYAMVQERAREFLALLPTGSDETVAAFSHFGFMCAMTQVMLNMQVEHGCIPIPNCGILVFEHDGTRWKLRAWNYGKEL